MSILDEEIENRDEEAGLAVDADSLLFLSAYKYRDNWDIELAYFDFATRLGRIVDEAYTQVEAVTDIAICLTTKTNFRYDLLESYKATRKEDTEEAKKLKEHVSELKKTINSRLKSMVHASKIWEADDIVIQLSETKGYLVAAIDKDVINASSTKTYDYKNKVWNPGRHQEDINRWYVMQSIMGDSSDNIKGVKGMGQVKAKAFTDNLFDGVVTIDDYIGLFENHDEWLLMNRLVRMNQYDSDMNLKLATPEDIISSIVPF